MSDKPIEKNPIRVLQIIGIVCGGGVEAVIMNYYRHIDRTKIQFDFVVDGFERTPLDDEVDSMGGKVYHVTPYQKNVFKYMCDIAHIIRENHYMIVHSNMNTISAFSLFVAWLNRVPVRILHNHSMAVPNEGMRTVMKNILRPFAKLFANRYFACSKVSGEWMYGRRMMGSGKVKIINNAVNLEKFSYREDVRDVLRKELHVPPDTFVMGHIGRFAFPKNHSFLLDVFAEVHKRNPKFVLVLVGDGELRPQIEEKIKQLKIEDSVMLLGLRKDADRLYNIMDVFVMPSWYEGLPVVAVEAQANGLRCLLSDQISEESRINNNVDFLSLNLGADVWAEKILDMEVKRVSNAKEKMKDYGFSVNDETQALEEFYADCVAHL